MRFNEVDFSELKKLRQPTFQSWKIFAWDLGE